MLVLKILIAVLGLAIIFALVIYLSLDVRTYLRTGVPTINTNRRTRRAILALPIFKAGQTVYDLGCGNGQVLAELVRQYHFTAIGYELNPSAYLLARLRAAWVNRQERRAGHSGRLTIRRADYFTASLADADIVFVYLLPANLTALRTLLATLPPQRWILSNTFTFDDRPPVKTYRGNHKPLYLYQSPL